MPAPSARRFFADDVVFHELPNRLVPHGVRRDLAAILESAERGQRAVRGQRYEVRSAIARGDEVAMEIAWSAELLVPLGDLAAGDTLRASIGMFVTYRDGGIVSQRNYDCYPPF